jgi:hypothetical protein
MAMFSFYGDASGNDDTDLVVVAGFVPSAQKWLEFNKEWEVVMREFGVEYLHMREFAHSQGHFSEGWKGQEDKRKAFLDRMEQVIAAYAEFWCGTCLLKKDYLKVDADYQLHENLYPFPLIVGTIPAR